MKYLKNPRAVATVIEAILIGMLVMFSNPVYAAGLEKVEEGLNNIQTGLLGFAVVVVTLAIMWCGYKLLFAHAQIMDVARVFMGAMVIGGASGLAGWFI